MNELFPDDKDTPYSADWLCIVVSVVLCIFFAAIFLGGMT